MRASARIEADGVHLDPAVGGVLDLLFDGRRVWSFRPDDVAEGGRRDRRVPWPSDLERGLRGRALVAVRDAAGQVLGERDLVFGPDPTATERVAFADRAGNLLVVDTSGRLVRTFEDRGAEELRLLIEAVAEVIGAIGALGLPAFPAYGTLLGAVRSGRVIGHDNDADVAYISSHDHPVDVIRESFRLQRLLHRQGYEIVRYSGGGFKIVVASESGVPIGLDVFTGFFRDGTLSLMGEIHEAFDPAWMLPLGEVELEGRTLPAPRRPDKLLEAMYGPGWRVPDPTFTFATSEAVKDRLDAWFRGTRTYRNVWDRRYATLTHRPPADRRPHELARALARAEAPGTRVLDLGCGRGQDALWLAKKHFPTTAIDYSPNGYAFLAGRAAAVGLDATFATGNLLESRHVVALAGRFGRHPGPKAVLARHVLDATTARGRDGLWRLARGVLSPEGGRLYAEFMCTQQRFADFEYADDAIVELEPEWVVWEAERAGGVVMEQRTLDANGPERPAEPLGGVGAAGRNGRGHRPRKCRLVVEWRP